MGEEVVRHVLALSAIPEKITEGKNMTDNLFTLTSPGALKQEDNDGNRLI